MSCYEGYEQRTLTPGKMMLINPFSDMDSFVGELQRGGQMVLVGVWVSIMLGLIIGLASMIVPNFNHRNHGTATLVGGAVVILVVWLFTTGWSGRLYEKWIGCATCRPKV